MDIFELLPKLYATREAFCQNFKVEDVLREKFPEKKSGDAWKALISYVQDISSLDVEGIYDNIDAMPREVIFGDLSADNVRFIGK